MKAENILIVIASAAAVYLLLQLKWAQAAPQTTGTDMLSMMGGNNMDGVFYRDYRIQ